MDDIKVTAEIEAMDQPGMLVRRVEIETPQAGDLQKQAAAIVEKIDYLGCELKVIEVDGVSKAVQIRSKKPQADGYIEIVLRGGNRRVRNLERVQDLQQLPVRKLNINNGTDNLNNLALGSGERNGGALSHDLEVSSAEVE